MKSIDFGYGNYEPNIISRGYYANYAKTAFTKSTLFEKSLRKKRREKDIYVPKVLLPSTRRRVLLLGHARRVF